MSHQRASAPPLLVAVFVAIMLLPQELSFYLGDLRLVPARALLLLIAPLAFIRFYRKLAARTAAVCWSDLLVIPTGVSFVVADIFTDGPLRAVVGAGAVGLDFVGAYLVVRGLLNSAHDVVSVAKLLSVLIAAVGLFGLLDTLSGHYAIHDWLAHLTHFQEGPPQSPRYGLTRASSTLEHPILLGAVCAFAIVLATSLRGIARWFTLVGATIGLFASISSGPIGGAFLGLACVLYRRVTIGQESRWRNLQIGIIALLAPIFIFHPSPFSFLFSHLTLEPQTAFYRLLIWQFAGSVVLASPLVGIGMSMDWARLSWMGASVDTVWLATALQFGIPASLLLAGTVIGACSKSVDTRRAQLRPEERDLGAALGIVIFEYVFIGFTVDYWGITWMLMGVIAGLRAQLGAVAYPARQVTRGVEAAANT